MTSGDGQETHNNKGKGPASLDASNVSSTNSRPDHTLPERFQDLTIGDSNRSVTLVFTIKSTEIVIDPR
jgi:hypothetical protein